MSAPIPENLKAMHNSASAYYWPWPPETVIQLIERIGRVEAERDNLKKTMDIECDSQWCAGAIYARDARREDINFAVSKRYKEITAARAEKGRSRPFDTNEALVKSAEELTAQLATAQKEIAQLRATRIKDGLTIARLSAPISDHEFSEACRRTSARPESDPLQFYPDRWAIDELVAARAEESEAYQ
jgi:DNA repair exonuclease SbcCD ATPase subunit